MAAIAIAAVGLSAQAALAEHVASVRDVLLRGHRAALAFERSIGFGGLIHDFKNQVLRPAESRYAEGVVRSAAEAEDALDELVHCLELLGAPARLEVSRAMLSAYRERSARVRELASEGSRAREIDTIVRFDDAPALTEIEEATRRLETLTSEAVEGFERRSRVIGWVTGVLGAGLVAAVLGFSWRHRRELEHLNRVLQDTNERLSRANTLLRQFAGIAAHDLRSPSRHIQLLCTFAREDLDLEPEVSAQLDRIESTAERLGHIVDSLLEFALLEGEVPDRRPVEVNELVRGVLEDHEDVIRDRRARIHVGELAPCHANPELLERVFANLVSNALNWGTSGDGPEPSIRIESEVEPDRVVYSVADDGPGIEPRHADRIFEPLRRLQPGGAPGSIGIGLSLVLSIAEGHGGSAWLDTENEGGARLCFSVSRPG